MFDRTIRPQDDLFRAASGGWLVRTVIPADRVTYGTFTELADKTEADIRVIVESVAADRERQRGSARQIADLYASLMDQRHTDELKLSLRGRPSPVIEGFTGEQRFFLSWAQAWKGCIRDEYLLQTRRTTPHAPPEYRENGPASNMPGFYEAFGVSPGDGMYREPSRRVSFW